MNFSYRCVIVLRRLTIELLEFFASAQFVPFIACAALAAFTLVSKIVDVSGKHAVIPERLVAFAYRPVWQVMLVSGLATYALLRLPRALRTPQTWWSTRRKASVALSVVIIIYMALFAVIFLTTRQAVPAVWVIFFGVTVASALYAFAVRYAVNKLIRRLSRPDLYRTVPAASAPPLKV